MVMVSGDRYTPSSSVKPDGRETRRNRNLNVNHATPTPLRLATLKIALLSSKGVLS